MQHIIGMPLQLIIIGMLQSFIIFIISMQQLFIMSMLMPAIGIILQVMPSAIMVHSIMHFIMGMPIGIDIPIIGMFMDIAMAASDMHIIDMLAHCIMTGMPQFIIICIISALFLNMAMSMPAAGFMVHIMPSSTILQVMVAIIIGMPIIGTIGMLALIGICIAFIMVKSSSILTIGCGADGADSRLKREHGKMLAKQHRMLPRQAVSCQRPVHEL
ncbi:hypothetical protein PCH70_27660 [Pseudomonas cichorii JBC1]|uniref:Uncharacterized protein n=1 Tax=Pseudomonas cichorii TaxID=36746 RepID=A0ABQ1DRU2_PSECI|nr:hypothetical protein PCH70_27660 [Pseudomonas cichorii JBC1]QVE14994.1 hypothetical protein KGD89_13775 [Pseudomonas cichorii]GFM93727.1 hypothetical protein PSCICP_36990 [Pseudomonas cichorii]